MGEKKRAEVGCLSFTPDTKVIKKKKKLEKIPGGGQFSVCWIKEDFLSIKAENINEHRVKKEHECL